jgi:hypothetical protein
MKRTLSSFEHVLEEVQVDEDLRLTPRKITAKGRGVINDDPGYDCSHMSTWRWMSNNTIFVPGMGKLVTTAYAERAAANKLGIKADIFLGPIRDNPKLVQQALQPSVNARSADPNLLVKVIARRFPPLCAPPGVDGILRGVVSPTYGEIGDALILKQLWDVGGDLIRSMQVDARRTDAASYFSFRFSDVHVVKALSEIGDKVQIGFKGWNSEVGYHRIQFDTFLERLVCTNGMVVKLGGDSLFSRRHVALDAEQLRGLLSEMWTHIPNMRSRLLEGTESLHKIVVADPKEELETFLARKGEPKYIQEASVKAYAEEPIKTAYGILQAITRLAVAARKDPDRQLRLEQLSGDYLVQQITKAS